MRHFARILTFSLASGALLLSGCGVGTMATESSSTSEAATISGVAHGGQQVVYNAVVRLYSAGTGGYGLGSTLLATGANTNIYGQFSFTKLATTGGVVAGGATPAWQCPATGNPIIYITAVGGNTQGTGTTATNNAASALMAVLGPCSNITSSSPVTLNEVSTVASVFAMGQYINPGGTTPGSVTMGTNPTTQANTGINNAALTIQNMASIASGQTLPAPPIYYGNGNALGTGTVAVTATAESAKLVTIADILGACINTPAATSANCTDLFANALPPLNPIFTSQPSATFTAPVDTIQAAYYMATNPASLGTAPATCANAGGVAAATMNCLFGLASALASPFPGGLTAVPSDWTIGITFTATGSCSVGGAFFAGPTKAAVDVNGNLWFINGVSASGSNNIYANFGEISPLGAPMACLGAGTAGRGLTIDPTGNVWASFNATSGPLIELPAGSTTVVNWPSNTGTQFYSPYTVTSDGEGNIYFTNIASGGQLLQFAAPLTSTTPTLATLITPGTTGFNSTTSTTTNYEAADPNNRIWVGTSTTSKFYENYYTATATSAPITSYSITAGTGSQATATVTYTNTSGTALFAPGNRVQVSGLSSGTLLNTALYVLPGATATTFQALVTSSTTVAPTADNGTATLQQSTIGTTSTTATSYGLAIDSNNFVYNGQTCCGAVAYYKLVQKTLPGSTGTGTVAISSQYIGGVNGVRSVELDGAGNMWIGNEFSSTAANITTFSNYPVAEVGTITTTPYTATNFVANTTFTALSPTGNTAITSTSTPSCTTGTGCPTGGGFIKNDFVEIRDFGIDPSGNVWALNTGNETTTYAGTSITEIVGAAVPTVTPLSLAIQNKALATKP